MRIVKYCDCCMRKGNNGQAWVENIQLHFLSISSPKLQDNRKDHDDPRTNPSQIVILPTNNFTSLLPSSGSTTAVARSPLPLQHANIEVILRKSVWWVATWKCVMLMFSWPQRQGKADCGN